MGPHQNIAIELSAVIVSLSQDGQPHIIVANGWALPSGPLETQHKKLEQALRAWVRQQSGLTLGYVEQLYTFADKDRESSNQRTISIGYLALARDLNAPPMGKIESIDWYQFFPWEDQRGPWIGHKNGTQSPIISFIRQSLKTWKNAAQDTPTKKLREARIAVAFPKDLRDWNEELVLQRYELLWEAGLLEESRRSKKTQDAAPLIPSFSMAHDHRRILATGIARLRAKIKYRPVVFELLPDQFTLLQLQNTVEALAGLRLHKQNFRRLIQSQGLVEETPQQSKDTRGRPAKLFAFRREILRQRAVAGTKLPRSG
ncbi:MAG: hypothetical protein PHD48_02435 [Alphaproteobacteria bacterium]|nr:hypothetical protein [Alphaproteobacteria bacterium]